MSGIQGPEFMGSCIRSAASCSLALHGGAARLGGGLASAWPLLLFQAACASCVSSRQWPCLRLATACAGWLPPLDGAAPLVTGHFFDHKVQCPWRASDQVWFLAARPTLKDAALRLGHPGSGRTAAWYSSGQWEPFSGSVTLTLPDCALHLLMSWCWVLQCVRRLPGGASVAAPQCSYSIQ